MRRVLAVARTVTSLNRVLDVLPALADDPRVEVRFTVDEGSAYAAGVGPQLDALGAQVVPWSKALEPGFDLAIAANDNGSVGDVAAPLLLVRHGAGFHKGGASRRVLGRGGPEVRLVLSHSSQQAIPAAASSSGWVATVVAGDPCLDRIRAGHRVRHRYRAALGVADDQRLVAVTSTWGPESTLGRQPDLMARMLAELPADEYQVAAAFHPNIWAHHGAFQVRCWLRRAIDAGLILFPPTGSWEAGLVAADTVIGDHGSQTAYALDLGLPVLLAAFGADEIVPRSPMAGIGRRLPRVDPEQPIAEQLDMAIAEHDPTEAARLVANVFACRDRSLTVLQATIYEMLGLPLPPGRPRPRPIAVESPPRQAPAAFHVEAETIRGRGADAISLRRFPAVVADFGRAANARHLVVDDIDAEPALAESAAVVVRRAPDRHGGPDALLARFPACRIAADLDPAGEVTIHVRGRGVLRARIVGGAPGFDPALAASAVYAHVVAGADPGDLARLDVRCGARTATVVLEPTGR